ncbi:MAG: ribonuclease P protein subunit [Nitrososphaerales archaeon]|nr:ribonuclease P protein subunit [Nitrososphaerales archaeon]
MSVVGQEVTVMDSSDNSMRGRRGEVVLETANTLLLRSSGKTVKLAKAGSVLLLEKTGQLVTGDDLAGRLEDRLRVGKR